MGKVQWLFCKLLGIMKFYVGHFWQAELAMRDEPNVGKRCLTARSSDIIKGVGSFEQQDGGHGSRNPLRSV